jgi:hypothetical protein
MMVRNMMVVAVAGLILMGSGASAVLAQSQGGGKPAPTLKPRPVLKQYGLMVNYVVLGGPAHRQGIEVGDIIVRVNGNPVRSSQDLHYWIGRSGRVAQLEVIDCNTGWLNLVNVYPRNGMIGVGVQPVPLNGHGPDILPLPISPPRR